MAEASGQPEGQGQAKNSSETYNVGITICCLPIPCCVVSNVGSDKLKLIGAVTTAIVWLCSVIVVAVINDSLFFRANTVKFCFFEAKDSNCEYGQFCGGLSIFLSMVFGVFYALHFKPVFTHPFLGSPPQLLGEAVAGAIMALFFLICACVLAFADRYVLQGYSKSSAGNAVVTFSYFATMGWVLLAYIPYMLFKSSKSSESSTSGGNANGNANGNSTGNARASNPV